MRLGVDAAVVDGVFVAGDVDVIDGTVASIGRPPAGTDLIAAAGFVDLQVNGFSRVDLLTADADDVLAAARALRNTGVTAWQPTLITSPVDETIRAIATIGEARNHPDGDDIIGVHLEGPFLSPDALGAHPGAHLRDPDGALLGRLLAAGPVSSTVVSWSRPVTATRPPRKPTPRSTAGCAQ